MSDFLIGLKAGDKVMLVWHTPTGEVIEGVGVVRGSRSNKQRVAVGTGYFSRKTGREHRGVRWLVPYDEERVKAWQEERQQRYKTIEEMIQRRKAEGYLHW